MNYEDTTVHMAMVSLKDNELRYLDGIVQYVDKVYPISILIFDEQLFMLKYLYLKKFASIVSIKQAIELIVYCKINFKYSDCTLKSVINVTICMPNTIMFVYIYFSINSSLALCLALIESNDTMAIVQCYIKIGTQIHRHSIIYERLPLQKVNSVIPLQ